MQYVFHRQKGPKQGSKLPSGLPELMNDITREVLREKPSDVETYKFVADYLDSLLTTRERVSMSVDVIDDVLESSLVISDLLTRNGIDLERATTAAKVIQDAFRKYANSKSKFMPILEQDEFDEFEVFKELTLKCDFREEELITVKTIIRTSFREFFRKYSNMLKSANMCSPDTWPSVRATLQYYANQTPSLEQMNKAATKIQAYYRRHSCLKKLMLLERRAAKKDSDISLSKEQAASFIQRAYRLYKEEKDKMLKTRSDRRHQERISQTKFGVNNAATKIQSRYRGYKVRKSLQCEQIMQAREIQSEFERILLDSGARAINTATAAVQKLFRRNQKAGRYSWTDSKMDAAAQTIQDIWSDFAARRDYIRNLYREALGETWGLNSICDPNEIPFRLSEKLGQAKGTCDKCAIGKESLQGIEETFDMVKMKTDVKALIKALGFNQESKEQTLKKDPDTKYTFVIEKLHASDDMQAENDKLQYDVMNDELVVEYTDKNGIATKLVEAMPPDDSNLSREYEVFNLYRTQPFDLDLVKKNMWNLIEKFATSRSSLATLAPTDRNCVYLIKVNRFDMDGSVHEEEKITYRIEGNVMTVEHVDKDGNVFKRQDSLPALFKGIRASDIAEAATKGMDIKAVKEQLESILKAFGRSEGPDAQKHGVYTINVEHIDPKGSSTKKEQKITYSFDGGLLTVEHIDMDGRKSAFKDIVPLESLDVVESINLNTDQGKKAFEASLRRMVCAVTGEDDDKPFKVTVKVSDSEKDEEKVIFGLEPDQMTVDDKDVKSIKVFDLDTVKENVKGIIKALGPSEKQPAPDGTHQAHGVYSVQVEQINADGSSTKEEEKITYDMDGGRVILEHIDKDGNVSKHEEIVPAETLKIEFPSQEEGSDKIGTLKTHLKAIVGSLGHGVETTGGPDVVQHGTFKIRVEHYDAEGGVIVDEENITYDIDGDQITTEPVGKDGTATKRNATIATEGIKIELPKFNENQMVDDVKKNVVAIIKALGPPQYEAPDQKRHGIYRVAVEHVGSDGAKTEEKVTYNIEDGEVLLEQLDRDGNVMRHHQGSTLDAPAPMEPMGGIEPNVKMDLEEIKANIKDMLKVFAGTQNAEDADRMMHGTIAIKVEYCDPESGTTKEDDKFIYDIDNDKFEFKPAE